MCVCVCVCVFIMGDIPLNYLFGQNVWRVWFLC